MSELDNLDLFIKSLDDKDKREFLDLLTKKEEQLQYRRIDTLYQDKGPFRRELYPKHVEWMNASLDHSQLAFIAANRSGKTLTGAILMTYWLTGEYPGWFEGRKFLNPIKAWAAGITNQSTKDAIQETLLGPVNDIGSGTIPKGSIIKITKKPGVADAVETVYVRHISGGVSSLTFKAYEQGWESFQGAKRDVIWLDEEPKNPKIYSECITRTMDMYNPGLIMCTFTPLLGMTDVVMSFLPNGQFPEGGEHPEEPDKFVSQVSWDEVPHMSEDQKKKILATYSEYEKSARSKGIPSLGSGAIYPYPEDDIFVNPIKGGIPAWWPRAYGMDVGFNCTAALFGAIDPDSGVVYIYSEYYSGRILPGHDERLNLPAIHAESIKQRGEWLWGAIDPAARGRNASDGQSLIEMYEKQGLNLVLAKNGVDSGIYRVGQMFMSGRLKIFNTCVKTLGEFRTYARDEDGKINKKNDHAMDALRYFVTSGIDMMEVMPDPDEEDFKHRHSTNRDKWTGY